MAQRATGAAKRPAATRTNRAATALEMCEFPGSSEAGESELATMPQDESAAMEISTQKGETSPASGRASRKAELDESKFASLTADIILRKGKAQPLRLAPSVDSSDPEPDKSGLAGPGAGILVHKGAAQPSAIAVLPTGAKVQSESVASRHQDDAELRRLRDEMAALRTTLTNRESELAHMRSAMEQAREQWRSEAEETWDKAERAWEADEAARMAAAEAQWRKQSASALTEATTRCERAENSLAEAYARANAVAAHAETNESELRRLREERATLQATLADRETKLARVHSVTEQAREQWRKEAEETLRKAEQARQAGEAARLAAAEAQWRKEYASALAELTTRCERAETSLAEANARANAVAARGENHESELLRLREERTTLQAALTDRDTKLAQVRSATGQAEEQWRKEAEEALSKAEKTWKADEANRLSAAEAQWQERSARALADAHAEAKSARNQSEEEHRRLRDELAALQASLAERQTAPAPSGLDIEQARQSWAREAQDQLQKAEKAWKAGEAARSAAAEAQWQKQSASALAEVTARCEAAEAALAQTKALAARERDQAAHTEDSDLYKELAMLRAKLADRETKLAKLRSGTDDTSRRNALESKIVIQPNRMRDALKTLEQERQPSAKRGALRDICVAAALAVSAVLLYPSIEPFLPESWRSNIAVITGGLEPTHGKSEAPLETSPPPAPDTAAKRMAIVIRDVNLRAGPSTAEATISTLAQGLSVAVLEQRGNWTLIQIEKENNATQPVQGWVFNSFLKAAGGEDTRSETAARE